MKKEQLAFNFYTTSYNLLRLMPWSEKYGN